MIKYNIARKPLQESAFPYDILLLRGTRKKQLPEYLDWPCYRITKFAEQLIMTGPWRSKLFKEGLDKSRFLDKSFEIEQRPLAQNRFRCFFAQDVPLGKKKSLQLELLYALLDKYKETIVVKGHPVHTYKGAITKQSCWWQNTCDRFGIPYITEAKKVMGTYAQTISFSSTACRFSFYSDNIVLTTAPLIRFWGARFCSDINELETVRVISPEEAQWRTQRYTWLMKHTTFPIRTIDFEKIKKLLLYQIEGASLDDY